MMPRGIITATSDKNKGESPYFLSMCKLNMPAHIINIKLKKKAAYAALL